MPLDTTPLPYGLREIKLTPYTDDAATTLAGTSIKLPNARTLSFAETEDFEELRGDDKLVASHGSGPTVEWELEGGGVAFEAVAAMYGGTVTETGVAPNQVKTLNKKATQSRPYFRAEGRAISDSGGDFHIVIYKCKATDNLEGELGDGQFFLTGASGVGMASTEATSIDSLWDFVQNETATPIA